MTGDKERSALDVAWASWVEGRKDEAIRGATAILSVDATQLGAALFLSYALAGSSPNAQKAAVRLVDAFVRRGDLPRALAAALLAGRAGTDPKPLYAEIAKAFARNSPRIADVAPAPPPLPPKKIPKKAYAESPERALERFVAHTDAAPADASVPLLPLFGALEAHALEQLLSVFELRELGADEPAIEEGAEGRDAFVVVRGRLRAERKRDGGTAILAVLGPGALFGEMALVSDAPRAASVVAEEPSLVLAASRDALEELAARAPAIGIELGDFCRARMVQNLVRHSPVLSPLPRDQRRSLMERFLTRNFASGDRLVTMGEETQGLFLIASGSVRVIGRDADGQKLEIATLGPGDVVGEISLVLRRPAMADVVATHPTLAMELSRNRFHETIKAHPALLSELYELATKREEELRSVVAQSALDVEEVILV